MASAKVVMATAIAATIAAVLIVPVAGSINDNTGQVSVTNESVSPVEVGNYTDLGGYNIDNSSETVWWYDSLTGEYRQLNDGTDYKIRPGPGEIKFLEGGQVSDGDDVKISYDYQATDSQSTTVINLVPLFMALLILGVFAQQIMRYMG